MCRGRLGESLRTSGLLDLSLRTFPLRPQDILSESEDVISKCPYVEIDVADIDDETGKCRGR